MILGNRVEALMSKPSDLVQGTLDLLLLKILAPRSVAWLGHGQGLKQVSGVFCTSQDSDPLFATIPTPVTK